MAQASAARRRIIYGVESVFGTTPADGKIMRNTGDSLNLSKNTIQSSELSGDRAIRFLRHGNETVSGDISFELAYGDFDDFIEAALGGTWNADVVKQGTLIRTFSIEKGFQDIVQYIVYNGCAINTLTIDMATDAVVTGTVGIVGAGTDGYTGASFDASPTAVTLTDPFVTYDGTVTLAGGDGCIITALSLSIDNGITANYALCSAEARSVTPDRVNVTGTATILFENATEVNKFITETTSSLSVTLEDPTGNALTIELPKIKYTGGDIPVSGGGVVSVSLPFQALYDDTAGVLSAIVVTRNPI
jgi:hypothetical protein